MAEIEPSGISRAPHEQPFQRPRLAYWRRAGRADDTVSAGPEAHAACFAGLPLLHSILLPTAMGARQHEHVDGYLAVMIMGFLGRLLVRLIRGSVPVI